MATQAEQILTTALAITQKDHVAIINEIEILLERHEFVEADYDHETDGITYRFEDESTLIYEAPETFKTI